MTDITRDRIEQALVELTGYRGDQAAIDAFMVIFDTYALAQAEALSVTPAEVRRGYMHLLMQQAELLLDSAGRLPLTMDLAEHVSQLTGLTSGLISRSSELADQVAALSAEIGMATRRAWDALVRDELLADLGGSGDRIPDSPPGSNHVSATEAHVSGVEGHVSAVAGHGSVLSEAVKQEVTAKLPVKATAKRKQKPRAYRAPQEGPGGVVTLHCTGDCGRDLPAASFFRNSKSPSGYESKCRDCRKARAA